MKDKLRNITLGSFLLSLFLLIVPQQAQGFVLDLAQTQLAALSERTGPIAAYLFTTFTFFVIGYLLLFISSFLLQGIIAMTPTALTVTAGDASSFVSVGWNFTAGIVNMILIIAFMVIAFAVIFGSTKIQVQKALPRLIIVALLVNFTLLFVGMLIDITNFLFNTIASQFLAGGEGGNIFFKSITPLFEFGTGRFEVTVVYLIASIVGLLVPYVNVAIQVSWIVGLPFIFTTTIQFIVYGAIMWGLAGVFFLYFLVFLIRIFVIQVLAVLAPLAFFCLIFDETRKYWNQWRDALLQWLFVGVIFIFLMYFGLAMAPLVTSMAEGFKAVFPIEDSWFGLAWFLEGVGNMIGYIALLAYFVVIIAIAKKFVPAAVGAMTAQVSGMAKMATPWAGAITKGAGARIRNQELERKKKIEERESLERPGFASKAKTSLMKGQSWMVRRAHNVTGTSVEQGRKKDIEDKVKALKNKHGDDYNDFLKSYLPGTKTDNLSSDVAALQFLSEGGADALTKLNPKTMGNLINLSARRGDSKTLKNAVKHIPDHGDVLGREEELEKAKQTAVEEIKRENPDISNNDLEKRVEKHKDVRKANMNLSVANKIQSAMMTDIKKVDPKVADMEKELKVEEEKLTTAINEGNNEAKEAAKNRISEIKKEIKESSRNAINKISVQSLKAQDIENLSGSTMKNAGFLRAVAENKNMNFIKIFEDRKDATEVIPELAKAIEDIGVEELKKVNPTLYNQIRKSPAGQIMFNEIHEKISSDQKPSK